MKFFFCFLSAATEGKKEKGARGTERKDGHWIISCRRTYCICKCHCSVTTRLATFAIVHVGTYTILEKFPEIRTIKAQMLAGVTFWKTAANTKLASTHIEVSRKWFKRFLLVKSLVTVAGYFSALVANVWKLFGGSIRVYLTSRSYER